jgi:hypothetical protein
LIRFDPIVGQYARRSVEQGWHTVSDALRSDGKPDIADAVDGFPKEMPSSQSEAAER